MRNLVLTTLASALVAATQPAVAQRTTPVTVENDALDTTSTVRRTPFFCRSTDIVSVGRTLDLGQCRLGFEFAPALIPTEQGQVAVVTDLTVYGAQSSGEGEVDIFLQIRNSAGASLYSIRFPTNLRGERSFNTSEAFMVLGPGQILEVTNNGPRPVEGNFFSGGVRLFLSGYLTSEENLGLR